MPIILVLVVIFVVLFVVFPLAGLALATVISAIIVGLVIGALGRLVVPGRQSIGLLATLLLGLIGSIVGGYIGGHVLGLDRVLRILLEIGVAGALVAVYSGWGRFHAVGRGSRHRTLRP